MTSFKKVPAPWNSEMVEMLNNSQKNSDFHPYTCGNDRSDEAHKKQAKETGQDSGVLIATTEGWKCPVCDYTQNWCHRWPDENEEMSLQESHWSGQ